MSIFKKIFGRKKPDKYEYLRAMKEMAEESERTHRGMVRTYNKDVALGILAVSSTDGNERVPTENGIYKARLFGALFIAVAYAFSRHSEDEVREMIDVANGVAIEPLIESIEYSFNLDDARALVSPYLLPTFKSISDGLKSDSNDPEGQHKEIFFNLANQLHDALSESIGEGRYTPQVREYFEMFILGNVGAALSHSRKWIFD